MKIVVLDFETDDRGKAAGRGPGWAFNACHVLCAVTKVVGADGTPLIWDMYHRTQPDPYDRLKKWELIKYLDSADMLVAHNMSYEWGIITMLCKELDIELPRVTLVDTLLLAKLADNRLRDYSLGQLAKRHGLQDKGLQGLLNMAVAAGLVKVTASSSGIKKIGELMGRLYELDAGTVIDYCIQDVELTNQLYHIYRHITELPMFGETSLTFLSDLIKATTESRANGVRIDLTRAKEVEGVLQAKADRFRRAVDELAPGVNINSGKQLANFFDSQGWNYPVTETGSPSFKSEWMSKSDLPLCVTITQLRKYEKALNDFVQPIVDGELDRVYPSIKIFGAAATGRASSNSPNIQQIPKRDEEIGPLIRSMYLPEEGQEWWSLDFSSQEPRLQVHYAFKLGLPGSNTIVSAFKQDPDLDLHQMVADLAGIDKPTAKTINLGLAYGMGKTKLRHSLGIDEDQADAILGRYFKHVPFITALSDKCEKQMTSAGRIRTLGGRYLFHEKGFGYKALNKLVQGCLDGDTQVLTRDGLRTLRSLSGQEVEVWDGEEFVSSTCVPSGLKQKCVIELTDGSTLITSPDHRILTLNSCNSEKWRRTKDIRKVNNLLVKTVKTTPDQYHQPQHSQFAAKTNEVKKNAPWNYKKTCLSAIADSFQLGEVLGRVASDGSVHPDKNVVWLFADHEDEVKLYMEPLIGLLGHYSTGHGRSITRYCISSAHLARQLLDMGIKRRIPQVAWKNMDVLRGYLRGMFDGDGTVTKDGVAILTFGKQDYKKLWATDIQLALRLFGISARVRHYVGDRTVVQVIKKHSGLFADRIGFINPKKQSRLRTNTYSNHRYGTRIRSIEMTNTHVDMYDICNTKNQRFMANGYIVHNSAADQTYKCMVDAYRLGLTILFPVHDSLELSGTYEMAIKLKHIMETSIKLEVPSLAKVEYGPNWGTLTKLQKVRNQSNGTY